MTDRNVNVTLKANVDEYVQAMQVAAEATQQLLDLGIAKEDLGAALTGALGLAKAGRKSVSNRIDITWSTDAGKSSVIVDGVDITYWIANEPIIVESTEFGRTTVTVKLTAPNVTQTFLP